MFSSLNMKPKHQIIRMSEGSLLLSSRDRIVLLDHHFSDKSSMFLLYKFI
uniref:Uncharacterized protein n=1 Tax=Rhizophora mucronata TaxID=61149 RepID=A0A2P2IPK4_RHIMU